MPKRNDNFRQKIVVSFCTFRFSLFVLLSSLTLSFPEKREERKEKRKGSFRINLYPKKKHITKNPSIGLRENQWRGIFE